MNAARFINEFAATLDQLAMGPEPFDKAWSSSESRTVFYKGTLMPQLAGRLGLSYHPEQINVDYLLCTRDVPTPVPMVWVESENAVLTAEREIWKLCCLNAPLKVLLTVMAVDEQQEWGGPGTGPGFPAGWQKPGECLNRWRNQVAAFVYRGIDVGEIQVLGSVNE